MRLILFIMLFPAVCFGAFSEFYCNPSTGSNLNAGSTTGSPTYSTTGGNWVQSTRVFTVTDGTNPSLSVNVGDIGSVFATGATVTGFLGKVSAVQNAINGTVTFGIVFAGASPVNGTGNMTLNVGGHWKGPNGTQSFPLNVTNLANLQSGANEVRVNLKNNATYSITVAVNATGAIGCYIEGYSSTPGDGGKAIFDGGSNAIDIFSATGDAATMVDIVATANASSGTNSGFAGSSSVAYVRCIAHGMRGAGFQFSGPSIAYECEAYDNNRSNTSTATANAGFNASGTNDVFIRCYSHDNTGSNTRGFYAGAAAKNRWVQCIADSNGLHGFEARVNSSSGAVLIQNCDSYNNGISATGDGILIAQISGSPYTFFIENCNTLKNSGYGINVTADGIHAQGFVYNCGYGSGTQANTLGDSVLGGLIESGKVTYEADAIPWVAPNTGDFTITNSSTSLQLGTGRGFFLETDGTNTGTVGYPDIGSAQHNDNIFSRETSHASAH